MRSILTFLFLFFVSTQVAFAQADTSEFTIKVFGGSDTEKPTTPTLLSVAAIGPTQIDISWSTSTDNFSVGGYVVFRGSTTIATTTQTTFSDVGLAASTTYSYFVQAFDVARNYSTSSNALSVKTPDFPVEPDSPPQPSGTVARVVAESVEVSPGRSTTSISVTTAFHARFEIKWGRTASYELGYIASESLQRNYLTTITDLEPGTVYEYEIIGYTPFGKSNVVDRGQFKTLDALDLSAPINVSSFSATADVSDVRLNWNLPTDDDLAYVRIVRSHLAFPASPSDGVVVYQGLGVQAIDASVLSRYSPVYYTAFAVDASGNVSSGAVALVYANQSTSDGFNNILNKDGELVPIGDGDAGLLVPVTYRMPIDEEIQIVQNTNFFSFADNPIPLIAAEKFLIKIPTEAITTNIKTIIASLQDPTDHRKSYSFLLRLNKERSAYEAVLSSVNVLGESSLSLTVYDYEAQLVGNYVTRVSFSSGSSLLSVENIDAKLMWWFFSLILLLLLLLLLWLVYRSEDEDKEDDSRLPKRYSTDS